jgi:hypothetical protein
MLSSFIYKQFNLYEIISSKYNIVLFCRQELYDADELRLTL